MSPPKLFITGATGYIAGDFLAELGDAHPGWNVSCLVRSHEKGRLLEKRYPQIQLIYGNLDSANVIEEAAANANIVLHCASADNVASAQAIARGLARNSFPHVYWIHTSGSGILTHRNFASKTFGQLLPGDEKIYDDWENVNELTSLPDYAIHRHVDKIVLNASRASPQRIRTAIVAPSCIYGVGRGTSNTRSVQIYEAAQIALSRGRAAMVGAGTNIWNAIHVRDLSKLYLKLSEAAVTSPSPATWNEQGYYLAEDGEFAWGEAIQTIAKYGYEKGLLKTSSVESLNADESRKLHQWYPELTGTTSRGNAKRARMLLGWEPKEEKFEIELPRIVEGEAKILGLKVGSRRDSKI